MDVTFSPSGEFFASVGADEQVHMTILYILYFIVLYKGFSLED